MLDLNINLNVEVEVILTTEGEFYLRHYYTELNIPFSENLIKENKKFRAPLWEIMQIFGKYLYNGCEIPFKNNIIQISLKNE